MRFSRPVIVASSRKTLSSPGSEKSSMLVKKVAEEVRRAAGGEGNGVWFPMRATILPPQQRTTLPRFVVRVRRPRLGLEA